MFSIILQILELASFIALMVVVWRASKWPRWRIRAVVYGWGLSFLWSFFWAVLMPMWFRSRMNSHAPPANTFPDGTIAMAFLVGGWFWPAVVIGIISYLDRRKRKDDKTA